jgi:hypothetical protein
MLASLTFVTPSGGLLALAVLAPVAAFAVSARQTSRGRALLQLAPPESDRYVAFSALAAVPLLLGLAAAGPALRTHVGHRIRTDAQAIFVFDTSRSMAASASFRAPTRFAQARAAAIQLRDDAIPEVPSGIASLTTQLLPHLFPTPNEATFNSTVENALGILKPPPPFLQFGVTGTSFGTLSRLRDEGFFSPTTKQRFAILLTDGESGPFEADALGSALARTIIPYQIPGRPPVGQPEPPVSIFIVRVGNGNDRIYNADGSIEATYRPDPRASIIVRTLADAANGHAGSAGQLSATAAALRKAVGSGHSSLQGVKPKTITLAPYVVLLAFAPLALIIRRRNLTKI